MGLTGEQWNKAFALSYKKRGLEWKGPTWVGKGDPPPASYQRQMPDGTIIPASGSGSGGTSNVVSKSRSAPRASSPSTLAERIKRLGLTTIGKNNLLGE